MHYPKACATSSQHRQATNVDAEDCNKKAQLLCDQLNKILNISTCLASESAAAQAAVTLVQNEQIEAGKTATRTKTKTANFATFNSLVAGSIVPNGDANGSVASTSFRKTSSMFKSKPVNRSHTFHSNTFKYEEEQVEEPHLNGIQNRTVEEDHETDVDSSTVTATTNKSKLKNASKNLISSYLFKSGRRFLLAWNGKPKACDYDVKSRLKQSSSSTTTSNNTHKSNGNVKAEEKIVNLIAAKLLSESIELAKAPYTDEVGF